MNEKDFEKNIKDKYQKIESKFIDKFLRKKDETVEEAKARLKAEEKERKDDDLNTMSDEILNIDILKK